ncbi:uncharacterized protein PHALS_03470 [Plasmopara halstedii]|uniref:Uncharacterized protein n=1 Tax=Plasmopara halstedii TaxID=4781 RepID=A0A0P1AYI3_PLAHL|nr:uncharacterized protein PHALS_03470 [Plasmopara halstedii]CEG46789.1 hypothetical protein PHALS_03470 [Plasmopara halstedii]|eukprot:XP_024583158.1 hypothetical protein PHALS_03470 [Plasmopara halstedii]
MLSHEPGNDAAYEWQSHETESQSAYFLISELDLDVPLRTGTESLDQGEILGDEIKLDRL